MKIAIKDKSKRSSTRVLLTAETDNYYDGRLLKRLADVLAAEPTLIHIERSSTCSEWNVTAHKKL